jgi:hypothetical protein
MAGTRRAAGSFTASYAPRSSFTQVSQIEIDDDFVKRSRIAYSAAPDGAADPHPPGDNTMKLTKTLLVAFSLSAFALSACDKKEEPKKEAEKKDEKAKEEKK